MKVYPLSFQIIHANEGNNMFHFGAKNAIMEKEFDDKNLYIRRSEFDRMYSFFQALKETDESVTAFHEPEIE